MSVKLRPRPRSHALSLLLFGALAISCAPEDEDDANNGLGQTPGPIQSGSDAALPDTGVPMQQPMLPDAASPFVPPNAAGDGGAIAPLVDSGLPTQPAGDAGAVDAGPALDSGAAADSGAAGDAGATGDAGACPTYENFGRMFMMTYCVSCHTGAAAPRMARLDTLAGVMAQKSAIQRVAVTSMEMPPSGTRPSAAERMKLGQWLNCGPM